MDHNTNMAAMNVALFCRLNLNKKCCIPIRHSEMGVLIYANLAKEPVTPVTISNQFGITKPSATAILKILKEHEYIEHCPSQVDGRSYTITVTEKGKKLIETLTNDEDLVHVRGLLITKDAKKFYEKFGFYNKEDVMQKDKK